jgi:hypothetical protein
LIPSEMEEEDASLVRVGEEGEDLSEEKKSGVGSLQIHSINLIKTRPGFKNKLSITSSIILG